MGRGLSHWWRRLVTGGLMDSVTFEGSFVGWVERSETHHVTARKVMGFASLYPSYRRWLHTTGLTPGSALTRSRKAEPRISKLRYWSKEAQAGDKSTTGPARPEASASRAALATATSSVSEISYGTRSPRVVANSAAASPIR